MGRRITQAAGQGGNKNTPALGGARQNTAAMKCLTPWRHSICAFAIALGVASNEPAAAQGVRAGLLTCDVSAGIGYVVGSHKDVSCALTPDGIGKLLKGLRGGNVAVPSAGSTTVPSTGASCCTAPEQKLRRTERLLVCRPLG
jgi:hypothetical protein